MDTIGKQLVRKDGFKVSYWERNIPQIILMEENIEEGDTVLILDTASHYANHS